MDAYDELICLELAQVAALEAGALLKQRSAGYRHINFEDDRDVKLQADVESEKLIRERLHKETGFPIIGEEQGGDPSLLEQDTPFWVVDPLDGTYNYLREQSQCCVSIGLMRGREFLLGVIYDFNCEVVYVGTPDSGLKINGETVNPVWATELSRACLVAGFPRNRDYESDSLKRFVNLVSQFKKVRIIGSAAMALAQVAAGRCDVYYEESIYIWDIAAGIALLQASGGYVDITPIGDPKEMRYTVFAVADRRWVEVLKENL